MTILKISRKALQDALAAVGPALYEKDTVEELGCLWFRGGFVSAYDGEVGLEAPLAVGFEGGIKGKLILALVNNSKNDQVTIEPEGQTVIAKSGTMKATLNVLPSARQPPWPATEDPNTAVKLTKEFLASLKNCMRTPSVSDQRPDFLGVTVIMVESNLNFYASDGATLSWTSCKKPQGWMEERIGLPYKLCDQLIKLAKPGDEIQINKGVVTVWLQNDMRLVGRQLTINRPINFASMLGRLVPENLDEALFPITEELEEALRRAKAISGKDKKVVVVLGREGKYLSLTVKSGTGTSVVEDEIAVATGFDEVVQMVIAPELLDRAIPHADSMLVSRNCIILSDDKSGLIHIISPKERAA